MQRPSQIKNKHQKWTDLTFSGLESFLAGEGVNPIHAATLWKMFLREGMDKSHPDKHGRLPQTLNVWLAQNKPFVPEIVSTSLSDDGLTRKSLLRLEDGEMIETVLMGYTGRTTACVSTQVGCAMGCSFCASGQSGLTRNLRAGEIVAQVVHCAGVLQKTDLGRLRNVVLMGMGEPLHNYDSVMNALEIISDSRGLNIGSAHITVSTVGHVPGILRMAEENRPFNLAISLHGASDAVRESLVPAGKRWPLDELLDACRFYGKKSGRRIFFEWTLVSGKNDTLDQAEKLAEKISGIDAHVNLIQLNATASFHGAPPSENMARSFSAH